MEEEKADTKNNMDDNNIEHAENCYPLQIEQGNAAVLHQVGPLKGEKEHAEGLKLTKDGRVSYTLSQNVSPKAID
jgi:hypothetical protein